jgi:hypothetical protein
MATIKWTATLLAATVAFAVLSVVYPSTKPDKQGITSLQKQQSLVSEDRPLTQESVKQWDTTSLHEAPQETQLSMQEINGNQEAPPPPAVSTGAQKCGPNDRESSEENLRLTSRLQQLEGGNVRLTRRLQRIEGRVDWSVRLKGLKEHVQNVLQQLAHDKAAVVNVFGQIEEIKKEDFERSCGEGIADFTKLIDESKVELEASSSKVEQASEWFLHQSVHHGPAVGGVLSMPLPWSACGLQVICIHPAQLPLRIRSIIDSSVKCRRQVTFQTAVIGEPRDHAPVTLKLLALRTLWHLRCRCSARGGESRGVARSYS